METWSFVNGSWRPGDLAFADLRWFDLIGSPAGELETLAERFSLHPLAVEDCLSQHIHAPKVDEFGDHLFVVIQAVIDESPGGSDPQLEEIDIFLARGFLITFRERPVPEIDDLHAALRQGRSVRAGADGLLYEVSDRIVDGILPEVNRVGDALEGLQDEVLDHPEAVVHAHRVTTLRAQAGKMRRLLGPQMTVFQRISRGEYPLIDDQHRVYFRDIYDHLMRIDITLEAVREDAEVVLNTYLSVLNNRLNEVMRLLAAGATVAIPGTIITGMFGTNFDDVPWLHEAWGFWAMNAIILACAAGLALFFRRKHWW